MFLFGSFSSFEGVAFMKFLSLLAKQISSALFWTSPKGTLCHVTAKGTEKQKLNFFLMEEPNVTEITHLADQRDIPFQIKGWKAMKWPSHPWELIKEFLQLQPSQQREGEERSLWVKHCWLWHRVLDASACAHPRRGLWDPGTSP